MVHRLAVLFNILLSSDHSKCFNTTCHPPHSLIYTSMHGAICPSGLSNHSHPFMCSHLIRSSCVDTLEGIEPPIFSLKGRPRPPRWAPVAPRGHTLVRRSQSHGRPAGMLPPSPLLVGDDLCQKQKSNPLSWQAHSPDKVGACL